MAASREYELEPREVPTVETKNRRIVTQIPVPQSIPVLEALRRYEPKSMSGQPPIVWDRAERSHVYDRWGNMWLDFSCGVLVTNAGHGRQEIIDAIVAQAQHGLLTNYCFPSEIRAKLAQRLVELAPKGLRKVFLLSTGAETTECALKLTRTHGAKISDRKIVMVSFEGAFHGRTLGSQQIGGLPGLKTWIKNLDPGFVQVPFPDGYWVQDTSFELFERTLAENGIAPEDVAGVISETYQGGGAHFAPPEYMQALRRWCDKHKALLIFDEVQAGFGRCGTMWGFEYYGVVPDMMCLGKGISSSLPISALVGRQEVLDQYPPGSMTSTHTGNPICCAAALASINLILDEKLVDNAAKVGSLLQEELAKLKDRFSDVIGVSKGRGMVAGLGMVKPNSREPDADLAWKVVRACVQKGLLMFSPVGSFGQTVKISPPLCATAEQIKEGVAVIAESIEEALKS